MDNLTALLGFLVTLSLATERVTELVKKLPILSGVLSKKRVDDSNGEHWRKGAVQVLAIVIGTFFALQLSGPIGSLLYPSQNIVAGLSECFLFGALASGGSGMWNSALDIVREVKQHKEKIRKQLAGG